MILPTVFMLLTCFAQVQPQNVSAPLPCEDIATTMAQLTKCAQSEFDGAGIQMEAMFRHVLKKHKSDMVFIQYMTAAQEAWLEFRDAEMAALFPHRESGAYGSSAELCWFKHLTKITKARTQRLKSWIVGVPEGEICAGSRPIASTKD